MRAIAFDLLIGGYSAKDDLSELAAFEGAVSDASKKTRQKKKQENMPAKSPSVEPHCDGEWDLERCTYPSTSRGCLTIAILTCVRS